MHTLKELKYAGKITALSMTLSCVCTLLSGCEKSDDIKKTDIFSEISLGMTSEEVFEIAGSDYTHKEEYETYKNTVEYDYVLDRIDAFDVDITGQMFFEFSQNDELICFGYHIGQAGDPDAWEYPYSEDELTAAYDSIYSQLSEKYGNGTPGDGSYDSLGVLKENLWDMEDGSLWFIVGVNMWNDAAPEQYEKGVNEILLSYSVS